MGYELSKPFLRAEMEADLVRYCCVIFLTCLIMWLLLGSVREKREQKACIMCSVVCIHWLKSHMHKWIHRHTICFSDVLRDTVQKYTDVFNQAVSQVCVHSLIECSTLNTLWHVSCCLIMCTRIQYDYHITGSQTGRGIITLFWSCTILSVILFIRWSQWWHHHWIMWCHIDETYYSDPVRKCPICKNSDMAVKKKRDGWCVCVCVVVVVVVCVCVVCLCNEK